MAWPSHFGFGDQSWGLLVQIYHVLFDDQLLRFLPHILMAIFLGFLIGMERRARHKSAGARTYLVISAASALITICGIVFTVGPHGAIVGDPTRLAGQILSGVGMLGVLASISKGSAKSGVTTGAMMLLAVAVGMGCGFGIFGLSLATTAIVLGSSALLRKYIGNNEYAPPVRINCHAEKVKNVVALLSKNHQLTSFAKREGTDFVDITVQPEIPLAECEAILLRLLETDYVRSGAIRDVE